VGVRGCFGACLEFVTPELFESLYPPGQCGRGLVRHDLDRTRTIPRREIHRFFHERHSLIPGRFYLLQKTQFRAGRTRVAAEKFIEFPLRFGAAGEILIERRSSCLQNTFSCLWPEMFCERHDLDDDQNV
jgi:hypothetical protein